jgi:hypothetical protein
VLLGGHAVAGQRLDGSETVCPQNTWAGCPRSRSNQELEFLTRGAPDGTHAASMRIYDLAGYARLVVLGTVAVDNVTGFGRAVASGDSTGPGSVSPSHERHHANRRARFTVVRASSAKGGLSLRHGRSGTIRGKLLAPGGNPVAGAVLRVSERVALPSAASKHIGTVRTRDDGSWTYPRAAGPSRTLMVTYTAEARTSMSFAASPVLASCCRRGTPRCRRGHLEHRQETNGSCRVASARPDKVPLGLVANPSK